MKRVICAVYDSAAMVFSNPPMFVPSVGVATRAFTDEVRRDSSDNQLNRHPGDFVLFELGSYDDEDGKFLTLDKPRAIIRGVDVVPKE